MATYFQTINKSINGATVSMCRSQCLFVRGEENRKVNFAVLDSSIMGSGAASTGKSDVPQENIAYIGNIMDLFTK